MKYVSSSSHHILRQNQNATSDFNLKQTPGGLIKYRIKKIGKQKISADTPKQDSKRGIFSCI